MLDTKLAQALKNVGGHEHALNRIDIDASDVKDRYASQMSRYIRFRKEGTAKFMVKSAHATGEHVLEQWRRVSWESDPKGLGSELRELQELTSTTSLRSEAVAGISSAIASWEELERRHRKRQGLELPEKLRISILFKLIPVKLAEEILKQNKMYFLHTAQGASALVAVCPDPESGANVPRSC